MYQSWTLRWLALLLLLGLSTLTISAVARSQTTAFESVPQAPRADGDPSPQQLLPFPKDRLWPHRR